MKSILQRQTRYNKKRQDDEMVQEICLEEGADDSGCVEIQRNALESDPEEILRLYHKTRSEWKGFRKGSSFI